jgi:hypothetical protein
MVASHLLAAGAEGDALAELASLSRPATGWDVDRLLDEALEEASIPPVPVKQAGEVVARALAQQLREGGRGGDHVIIRVLANRSPGLDYPDGVIAAAYNAVEWLDCECHRVSAEREAADELEAELRALPALNVNAGLIAALTLPTLSTR